MDRHPEVDYRGKWVLAPMVRACLLPFRLECLRYGADLVWSEEVIDKKVIESVRYVNPDFGTIGETGFVLGCHVRDCLF